MAAGVSPPHRIRFSDWASLKTSLIWIYEGLVDPQGRHLTVSGPKDAITCWLIREGSVRVTKNGTTTAAHPGQWIFVAATPRTQHFTDDAKILSIWFEATWPGGESLFPRRDNVVFDANKFPQLERASLPLLRMVRRHFPRVQTYLPQAVCPLDIYLRIQSQLPIWIKAYTDTLLNLGVLPRRLDAIDERVLQTVADADHFPLNWRFSDREFARKVGLSGAQLTRLFVLTFGYTPRQYFEQRRLKAACDALVHTSVNIKALAFSLGFRYESHFCAWFKHRSQMSPSSYREAHAELRPPDSTTPP